MIYIFGDVEIGDGSLCDDFVDEKVLCKELLKISDSKIIFNGDTFDFIKVPYNGKFPVHVNEKISLSKLKSMEKAHPLFFDTLNKIASKNEIYFLVGNHDLDIMFPKVKRYLQKICPGSIIEEKYVDEKLHVEHGHNLDLFVSTKQYFTKHSGEKIINYPYLSFAIIKRLLKIKLSSPMIERIKPWDKVMKKHPRYLFKIMSIGFLHILLTIINTIVFFKKDPSYKVHKKDLRNILKKMKKFDFELDDILPQVKPENYKKINVFGHVHKKTIKRIQGKTFIHPDTWRDEYYLYRDRLLPKMKRYVKIDEKYNYELIEIKVDRPKLNLNEVLKNQKEFHKKILEYAN